MQEMQESETKTHHCSSSFTAGIFVFYCADSLLLLLYSGVASAEYRKEKKSSWPYEEEKVFTLGENDDEDPCLIVRECA